MQLRLLSLNFYVCFSQSQPVKWKIGLTNLKRLLLKLLLARPRHCCAQPAHAASAHSGSLCVRSFADARICVDR